MEGNTKVLKMTITVMAVFLLFGCSAATGNLGSENEKEMTVRELKDVYGPSSPYNGNTTTIELVDITIDEDTLFNFKFVTEKNLSHFFEFGFYDRMYHAILSLTTDNDNIIYQSEFFNIDADEGNGAFSLKVEGDEVRGLFNSPEILYITLEVYDSEHLMFSQYNFVGAANSFVD